MHIHSLLVLQDALAVALRVASPYARDMRGHGVGGVQCHPLPGIVRQHAEHGLELRHIALQAARQTGRQAQAGGRGGRGEGEGSGGCGCDVC